MRIVSCRQLGISTNRLLTVSVQCFRCCPDSHSWTGEDRQKHDCCSSII